MSPFEAWQLHTTPFNAYGCSLRKLSGTCIPARDGLGDAGSSGPSNSGHRDGKVDTQMQGRNAVGSKTAMLVNFADEQGYTAAEECTLLAAPSGSVCESDRQASSVPESGCEKRLR